MGYRHCHYTPNWHCKVECAVHLTHAEPKDISRQPWAIYMLIILIWHLQGPLLLRLRTVRLVRFPLRMHCPALASCHIITNAGLHTASWSPHGVLHACVRHSLLLGLDDIWITGRSLPDKKLVLGRCGCGWHAW